MKRAYSILLVFIFMFAGCSKQDDVQSVDDIAIFYGASSYAMFEAEQIVMDDLYEKFNSLTFEETIDDIDLMSTFMVSFTVNGQSIKKFSVDKNGIFWLDGETQCYKVTSGSFDYNYLKKIYNESKQ